MDWIKRNLYFLIGALVALALMGLAGYYCYSNWKSNNDILTQLNTNYEELRRLNEQKPHPGSGKVDNIKAAKEQQQQVAAFIGKVRPHFEPIPRIPDLEKVSGQDFSGALSRTLSQLQREATNASVNLPPDYSFSFSAQKNLVSFSANSPGPLSVQLGEVKAICDILIAARVNSLDNLRREKICADDNQGTLGDYTDKKSITNTLAILTPYEVSFRCFTPELANVLAGFSSSPHNFVVTAINVDPAPAPPPSEAPQPTFMIIPQPGLGTTGSALDPSEAQRAEAMRQRYGLSGRGGGRYGGAPQPQEPAYVSPLAGGGGTAPMAAAPGKPGGKGGLQTVLNERPLKVIMTLSLVKLLPPKAEPAPPKSGPSSDPGHPSPIDDMNFLKKLKKNYEKFLLGAVLIGLAVAIGLLPFKIASERSKLVELTSSIIHINVQELTNLDLSMPEAALKRAAAPVSLNFGEPHKLFNPVPWQKASDGHLIKVEAGNIGPAAVAITKLTPLYLKLTLDSVTVVDSPRYVIGIEKEAATNPSQRGKTQKYSKLNDKNEVFALREVQGPPDNPTNIVLELNDSGNRVSISKEQPFRRVDGYMADLKYSPETKTWTNRRVGQSIAFGGDDYKIVAINKDEVILLAPSGKKTSIKNNAAL